VNVKSSAELSFQDGLISNAWWIASPVTNGAFEKRSYGVPGETVLPSAKPGPSAGEVPGPTNCWFTNVVELLIPRLNFLGAADGEGAGEAAGVVGVADGAV
jgi:hypothetical protein